MHKFHGMYAQGVLILCDVICNLSYQLLKVLYLPHYWIYLPQYLVEVEDLAYYKKVGVST